MAELDYQYIAGLVVRAENGDSDAFAELYAATYEKQYMFACCYLKDDFLAQDALQETYVLALKNLATLNDPKLFVSWLNQINFRVCYSMSNKQAKYNAEMSVYEDNAIDDLASSEMSTEDTVMKKFEKDYVIKQVMALPFSESQAVFLHYFKNIKIEDIACMMEISKSTAKRYLASGKSRLEKMLTYGGPVNE